MLNYQRVSHQKKVTLKHFVTARSVAWDSLSIRVDALHWESSHFSAKRVGDRLWPARVPLHDATCTVKAELALFPQPHRGYPQPCSKNIQKPPKSITRASNFSGLREQSPKNRTPDSGPSNQQESLGPPWQLLASICQLCQLSKMPVMTALPESPHPSLGTRWAKLRCFAAQKSPASRRTIPCAARTTVGWWFLKFLLSPKSEAQNNMINDHHILYIIYIYPLVMTNIAMVCWWPIEIDDFPSDINLHLWLGFSMANMANC
jgi:hypothetical protein